MGSSCPASPRTQPHREQEPATWRGERFRARSCSDSHAPGEGGRCGGDTGLCPQFGGSVPDPVSVPSVWGLSLTPFLSLFSVLSLTPSLSGTTHVGDPINVPNVWVLSPIYGFCPQWVLSLTPSLSPTCGFCPQYMGFFTTPLHPPAAPDPTPCRRRWVHSASSPSLLEPSESGSGTPSPDKVRALGAGGGVPRAPPSQSIHPPR